MKEIQDVARSLDLDPSALEPRGRWFAKIPYPIVREAAPKGRLVLVTAITPTPAGEGKTTTSVGLAQGLVKNGVKASVALREPSLGPYMGMKGGGTGGGKSEVVPAADVNLHFTGDIHAVTAAHDLLSAMLDNHLYFGNELELDPKQVLWKRVLDCNDRALRDSVVGLSGHGIPRQTGFDITAASEVMAILCLARSVPDLKERLGRIVVGFRRDKSAVTAADLKAVGAMAALLRDAIRPNLAQTTEGVPAFVHGGPFANIAHGTNSVGATRVALSLSDCVVTEAGFASDLGAEKFFDINCRYGDFAPSCTVLVATVRALKMHGGKPLKDVAEPDVRALKAGLVNLDAHVENVRGFQQPCIVAINSFPTDTEEEHQAIRAHCEQLEVPAIVARSFSDGGEGCRELAEVVWSTAQESDARFQPVYEWTQPFEAKIEAIAKRVYGADGVAILPQAKKALKRYQDMGLANLPVCMAKTHQSLSDDPKRLGRPTGFTIGVRDVELAAGAGFVVPLTGDMLRMPGLPRKPLAEGFDLTDEAEIVLPS